MATKLPAVANAHRNDTATGRADLATDAAALGAAASLDWSAPVFGAQDAGAMAQAFEAFAAKVAAGDTTGLQQHLAGQFLALSNVATALLRNAAVITDPATQQTTLRLAMRAQGQAAQTAKVIGELQNPAQFIGRQTNIAADGGQQVVANGRIPRAQARGIESRPNKLLEIEHGKRLDTGKTSGAGNRDQAVAALAAEHRTSNGRRQGAVEHQCNERRDER